MAKSLNYICYHNLNHACPKITATELNGTMVIQNTKYIWIFLKILAITTIIKYLKGSKGSSYIYGQIIKLLYESGQIVETPEIHQSRLKINQTRNPKETISKIIATRKWHYLFDPGALNLIIQIYREQEEGSLLQECIQELQNKTLQLFTVWSLSRFIPIPFLAFLFRIKDPLSKSLPIPIIDYLLLLAFPSHIFKISLFSAYSYYLDHPLFYNLIGRFIGIICPLFTKYLFHENKYNWYLLLSIPTTYLTAKVVMSSNLDYGTSYLLFGVLVMTTKFNFIYLWMILLGFFSQYSIIHLGILAGVLYFVINIVNHRVGAPPTIKMDVVKSYWQGDHCQNNKLKKS